MTYRVFLRKILTTDNFFFVFADKLDEIFHEGWIYDSRFLKDYYYHDDVVVGVDSTVGWNTALGRTCAELDLMDCWEYYNDLDWDVSDEVDSNIGKLLCAIVFDEDGNRIGK